MRTLLICMLLTAGLAGCMQPIDMVSTHIAYDERGDPAAGRRFVEERCSSCHAVGPTGASPYAPAPPLRTLHEKYDVEGLAEAFAEGILVGHKGEKQMPEFVLTPEEIDDLIAYLKSFE
ncbi:MAG: cytochrome c [Micropepsaceae bacterium]